VYGPSSDGEKRNFLDEAIAEKPVVDTKWLILGDFNPFTRPRTKIMGISISASWDNSDKP
jgi:hypothetical protein